MQCPSCHHRIGMLFGMVFTLGLSRKKYKHCPYCGIRIYRLVNPTWEYYKLISFIVGWIGVFLFLLAVIFGRQVGYETALFICFWFWLLIILVFLLIIFGNFGIIILKKILKAPF